MILTESTSSLVLALNISRVATLLQRRKPRSTNSHIESDENIILDRGNTNQERMVQIISWNRPPRVSPKIAS